MANRISLDPKYVGYYALAKRVIDGLIADKGEAAAYEYLFTSKPRTPPKQPTTELEYVRYYVANEFIAYRLALGGFAAFGATNYRGYFRCRICFCRQVSAGRPLHGRLAHKRRCVTTTALGLNPLNEIGGACRLLGRSGPRPVARGPQSYPLPVGRSKPAFRMT